MKKFVLLTDDNGCALVACADQKEAEAVGRAAVYSGGSVSAWLVPDKVLTDTAMIQRTLRADGSVADVFYAAGERLDVTIEVPDAAQ